MAQTYVTRDGDTVDYIAWAQYGSQLPTVINAVLDANPGIADYGPTLPAGITMTLPDVDTSPASSSGVSLWQ
ncbi:MAG: tail protein X [Achromobacter mucicolens]